MADVTEVDAVTGQRLERDFTEEERIAYLAESRIPVEEAWESLRAVRDALLSESDWTQLEDAPISDTKRGNWAAYRKALRDLPEKTTDPYSPNWPQRPI